MANALLLSLCPIENEKHKFQLPNFSDLICPAQRAHLMISDSTFD